jgi:glycerol-3-phosphate cytidylyltransferase-like family protein
VHEEGRFGVLRADVELLDVCDETPWQAAAAKKKVVYVAGAWSFLHPSHQHILREARKRGDYILVGIHDDDTRSRFSSTTKERYPDRLDRIRNWKGIQAVLKHAPWQVDRELMKALGISKVCAGRRCSADPMDPYYEAMLLGRFDFIEDPYAGVWRKMVQVMFTNVDQTEDPITARDMSPTRKPMNSSNLRVDELFTLDAQTGNAHVNPLKKGKLRSASYYFLHQAGVTKQPEAGTKRHQDLSSAMSRRDRTFGSSGGPQVASLRSPELSPAVSRHKSGQQGDLGSTRGSPSEAARGSGFDYDGQRGSGRSSASGAYYRG